MKSLLDVSPPPTLWPLTLNMFDIMLLYYEGPYSDLYIMILNKFE